jgi:hypothetical protein
MIAATIVDDLTAWFTDIYVDLTELANGVEQTLHGAGRRSSLTTKDLFAVKAAAEEFLDKHRACEGAGVVIQPGIVGAEGAVEWWIRATDDTTRRLLVTLTPQTAGFYDFETLEWFRNVVDTGRPTLTGPYVDYLGMDKYIITTTVPFRLDEKIIGAAGCDIEIRSLESALMPLLRRIDDDAALVTNTGRILLGNSGRFLVGNRVGELPATSRSIDLPVHELGLRLITVPREGF